MIQKKLHLAIGVEDIEKSVLEYEQEFGKPDLVIPNEYALWRTATINLSIRKTNKEEVGKLRHLGWEKESVDSFTSKVDCNGILWEEFNADNQADEINEIWNLNYSPKKKCK